MFDPDVARASAYSPRSTAIIAGRCAADPCEIATARVIGSGRVHSETRAKPEPSHEMGAAAERNRGEWPMDLHVL